MTAAPAMASAILDAAERFVRREGYNGFGIDEIAAAVGTDSAGVFAHFASKTELGGALARRYTDRFLAAIGDAADPSLPPAALLRRYVDAFRQALARDGQMCLCGILGAEVASLPLVVADETKRFFQCNVDWLETVLGRAGPGDAGKRRQRALSILSALEGAMILARTLDRTDVLDEVAAEIVRVDAASASGQRSTSAQPCSASERA